MGTDGPSIDAGLFSGEEESTGGRREEGERDSLSNMS